VAPIALSGPLTRAEVMDHLAHLKTQMQDHLRGMQADSTPAPMEVNLGGLTQVDTSALAMMLAVEREARAHGIAVHWRSIPTSLQALARLSSVESLFRFA